MVEKILEVRGLKTYFFLHRGVVKAVDGVGFYIGKGESFGLVGETGCGKSVTALSILKLVPQPGKIVGGRILLDGEDLSKKREDEMTGIRGSKVAMIFQDPTSSLNPVFSVGDQISEVIKLHRSVSKRISWSKAVKMLEEVKIPEAQERTHNYPHQFSGGMRQRVMIAMSLSCEPKLLIADEPTTALDVTIQAQILDLIADLRTKFNTSVLLITHNFGVISEMCDRVAVMYAGNIVEMADTLTVFERPFHPYTKGLLNAIPHPNRIGKRLNVIPGSVPNLINPPLGCKFHPRCNIAEVICRKKRPKLEEVDNNHYIACHMAEKISKEGK